MPTRRQVITATAATSLGLAGLGTHRSVVSGRTAYEHTVQQTWRHGMGVPSEPSALHRELVRYGTPAPSSHNTQRWSFRRRSGRSRCCRTSSGAARWRIRMTTTCSSVWAVRSRSRCRRPRLSGYAARQCSIRGRGRRSMCISIPPVRCVRRSSRRCRGGSRRGETSMVGPCRTRTCGCCRPWAVARVCE